MGGSGEVSGIVRVEFDASVDEFVDVSLRLANRLKTHRAQRRSSQNAIGVFFGVAFAVFVIGSASPRPPAVWAAAIGGAVALGALMHYVFGLYDDRCARRQYRRVAEEMFRGAARVRCEIELRFDSVWARQLGTELTFPWAGSMAITDAADGVELWFHPLALVLARDRAFQSAADRRAFLARARERADAARGASPAVPGREPRA